MKQIANGPLYLMRWDHSRDQRLGREIVETTHRLTELAIFSDEGLAAIIDRHPREALQVATMGTNPSHPSQLQRGEIGSYSGLDLIDMIRCGRLTLRVGDVATHHQELERIVHRLLSEIMECQPGLRTFDHDGDLEISSPSAIRYLGFDIQPNVAWQIRGSQTIFVYPAGEPLIDDRTLAAMIAANSSTPMYFEPAFDDLVEQFQVPPGGMLALPQHAPYRVVNDNSLCVTLKTRYLTREARHRNEAHRANYILNRLNPSDRRSTATSGFSFATKRLLLRIAGNRQIHPSSPSLEPTFRVNPDSALCVEPLTSSALNTDTPTPIFPGISVETDSAATSGSENQACDPSHSTI